MTEGIGVERFMDRVTIEERDGVADVRLARPEKLNAFDQEMFEAVAVAIERLSKMASVRCIVLSGAGRAFSVGIDLTLLGSASLDDLLPRYCGPANLFQHVVYGWRRLPQPVIAAVTGFAFGAGFQLMLGADIRICAPDAKLAIMESRWGLAPDMGGIALLRSLVRTDVARELTYTARQFSGSDAYALGLVTRLADDPHNVAMTLASDIARQSKDAIFAAKRLYNVAEDADVEEILLSESKEQQQLLQSKTHISAIATALAHRPVSGG